MKPARLAIGIIGMVILIIIGGGIAAIMAYIHGDSSVLGSLGTLLENAFNASWALGLVILGALVLFIYLIYSGMRGSTR